MDSNNELYQMIELRKGDGNVGKTEEKNGTDNYGSALDDKHINSLTKDIFFGDDIMSANHNDNLISQVEETNNTDTNMSANIGNDVLPRINEMKGIDTTMEEKKTRAPKKDRSNNRYSEEDFLGLSRKEQLALAEKYWNGPVSDFDDGTFRFSYAHFGKLCERIGFRKGIVDTMPEEEKVSIGKTENNTMYIDHGKRESVTKKMTFSVTTIEKIDKLLGADLPNIVKSKIVDAILDQALEKKLNDQKAGRFTVAYRPVEEERIL